MDFIKKLKSKSMRKSIGWAIWPLLFSLIFFSVANVGLLFQKPQYLFDVPESELEGAYVTVDVPFIYGSYAYEEEYENDRPTGKITSTEYVIDANNVSYCGLYLSGSLIEKGDALMEESYAYMDGETDTITGYFTVTGIMKHMPADSLNFYHEYVEYDAMSAQEQALFLPLYLDTEGGCDVVLAVGGVICLALAIFLVAYAGSGKYQKQLVQKANELSPGNPEYVYDRIAQLCQDVPAVKGLRIGSGLVYLEQGARQFLYGAQDVCWAYKQTTRHRLYGIIPMGKSYALVLRTASGAMHSIPNREAKVTEQLENIMMALPYCVVGYSKELETLYHKDRPQFIQIAMSQRTPR